MVSGVWRSEVYVARCLRGEEGRVVGRLMPKNAISRVAKAGLAEKGTRMYLSYKAVNTIMP